MNSTEEKKGLLRQILEVGNLLALIGLIFTLIEFRKSKIDDIDGNINQEVGYTLQLILPCWEQWKKFRFEVPADPEKYNDFISQIYIAEDKWNVTMGALDIKGKEITSSKLIKEALKINDADKAKKVIDDVLVKNIGGALSDFHKSIEGRRKELEEQKNSKIFFIF